MPLTGQIAYVYRGRVYILDLSTNEARPLEGLPKADAPALSPDGNILAFGRRQIILANLSDRAVAAITPPNEQCSYPAWNTGGTAIIYAVRSTGKPPRLRFHYLDSNVLHTVELPQFDAVLQPTWHNDMVAFVGVQGKDKHIYRLSVASGTEDVEACAQSVEALITEGQFNYSPQISHDGTRIALERYIEGQHGYHWSIGIYDLDTRKLTHPTPPIHNDHHPTWGTDDNYLIVERDLLNRGTHLVIYDLKTQHIEPLTAHGGAMPTWVSPQLNLPHMDGAESAASMPNDKSSETDSNASESGVSSEHVAQNRLAPDGAMSAS